VRVEQADQRGHEARVRLRDLRLARRVALLDCAPARPRSAAARGTLGGAPQHAEDLGLARARRSAEHSHPATHGRAHQGPLGQGCAGAGPRRARGAGHTIGQHAGGPRSGGGAARRAWHGRADQREDGVPPRQWQAPRAEEQAAAHARAPAGGLAAPEAQQLAGAQVVDGHQVGARADGHAHKAQAAAQVHGLAPPRRAPARRRARVGVARVWVDGAPGASE